MEVFAVHFEDEPTKQSVRDEYQQDHHDYLQRCAARMVNAGVLHRDEGGSPVGGFWLVRGSSELSVRELIEADPFFVHGLRRTVRVWQFVSSLAVDDCADTGATL
ncbi:MAG: hypothetical protein ACI8W7_001340 [Gammaproteobacteria bacterium]|jgi:uncharacterized protein YciI